jgi:hypothetical protein
MSWKRCDECGPIETILVPVYQREGGAGQERTSPFMDERCPNEKVPGTHVLSELSEHSDEAGR